ncbi:MAG: hypothetical protein AB7K09_00470 [Planctomycetota bacterium]
MPYCIYISRAERYSFIHSDDGLKRAERIEREDFERMMQGAPAEQVADGTFAVHYPDTNEPWFVAHHDDDRGVVMLRLSYSNPRFLRNFPDAFDLALRIADFAGAHVFEEAGGEEITRENIDTMLDPDGPLISLQVGAFRGTQRHVRNFSGALELPLGPIDTVPDYFMFLVKNAPHGGVATIDDAMAMFCGLRIERQAERVALAYEGESTQPLVHLQADADHGLIVRPAWSSAFADHARAVLQLLDALIATGHGPVTWRWAQREVTTDLLNEIRQHSGGLGVQFLEWAESMRRPDDSTDA